MTGLEFGVVIDRLCSGKVWGSGIRHNPIILIPHHNSKLRCHSLAFYLTEQQCIGRSPLPMNTFLT